MGGGAGGGKGGGKGLDMNSPPIPRNTTHIKYRAYTTGDDLGADLKARRGRTSQQRPSQIGVSLARADRVARARSPLAVARSSGARSRATRRGVVRV
jgi:hypothetical protein|tara:strand:+ start:756 stop:1046 length:291 start_codon:yes stop_codon:yes gene_type:complete|eukprot:31115-Pelagococcus_subviridis.AAC.6